MNLDDDTIKNAEMSVIGAILIDEKSLAKVIDKIKPDDFHYPYLREIYESILSLSNSGKPIDYVTVFDKICGLKKFTDEFTKNDIQKLLILCCETTPCIGNIEYYADIIHKSALAKRLEQSLLNAITDGIDSENAVQTGEILIDKLSGIISPIQNKKLRDLSEISQNLIDYYSGKTLKIENRCDTGYSKIDKILKGMSGGNLIILASRPKVGKTAFAISIAQNVSETGKKVMFYSQEMQGSELCERILAKKSGISMNKLIDNSLNENELERLKSAKNETKNNLIVNDSAGITV